MSKIIVSVVNSELEQLRQLNPWKLKNYVVGPLNTVGKGVLRIDVHRIPNGAFADYLFFVVILWTCQLSDYIISNDRMTVELIGGNSS
jgi:hypothetical protein